MHDAIRPRKEMERGRIDPHDELKRYLEGPLAEGIVDIVGYWGVSQPSLFDISILIILDSTKLLNIPLFLGWLATILLFRDLQHLRNGLFQVVG